MAIHDATPTDMILFIHGLWMTPRSWEEWMERYESRGGRRPNYVDVTPASRIASSRPGKRVSRSSRRSVFSRAVPSGR